MDAVGYTELGLKFISGARMYPIGGISSAPEKRLMTIPRDTLPAQNSKL